MEGIVGEHSQLCGQKAKPGTLHRLERMANQGELLECKFNSEVNALLLRRQVTMTQNKRLHLTDKQPKSIPGLASEILVKSQCQSFWCQDPVSLRLEVPTEPHLRCLVDTSTHSWLSSHHRQSLDCYTWVSFFDTRYRQIYAHPHCERHFRHAPCLGCFLYPRFQKLSLQSKRSSIVHSLHKFSGQ